MPTLPTLPRVGQPENDHDTRKEMPKWRVCVHRDYIHTRKDVEANEACQRRKVIWADLAADVAPPLPPRVPRAPVEDPDLPARVCMYYVPMYGVCVHHHPLVGTPGGRDPG